jgi:hypothetical protein
MKKTTHTEINSFAQGAVGNLVSAILKGEVLAFNSHSFNPIILPFFIRL